MDFNNDNEIIEINNDKPEVVFEEKQEVNNRNRKNKISLREKWNGLPKAKKISILLIPILIIIIGVGIFVCIKFFNKQEEKEPEIEPVIVEKDNYRYENGNLVFLDKSDRVLGTYNCLVKDVDKCYVAKNSLTEDNFERVKSVYENNQEIEKTSQIFLDNYVFIQDNDEMFLYNIKDKETILKVTSFKSYNTENNIVVIANEDKKYGLIEIKEDDFDYLIRPSYDYLGLVNTKLIYLVAKDKDVYYIINSEGKKLSKNITANIQSVNEELIVAINNDSYNLYSYDFDELISNYDYIGLYDSIVALVKDKHIYLLDNELNKLYEDGIRLNNTDYVKSYVYDSNNKLKETKKSFDIAVKDNIASITINDITKNININEGLINKNYDYINYFDGKLYFYSDIEKNEILGTYNCVNKNNIANKESILDYCSIYNVDDNYTGIYNNEYVIISDNNGIDNNKYYLYSLKENKTKGTYSEIVIVNEDEMNTTIKPIYTSESYLIAKAASGNSKDNYGILEINSEKLIGKVAFNYKKIEKINKYYLFTNGNDEYSLYDESFNIIGKTITKEKDYYILLDNYNLYSIYDSDLIKISDSFDYIKLYDNYYVGIKNNLLNVYRFKNVNGIIEKGIVINDNNYKIDFTNGIKITINDTTYEFDENGKVKEEETNEE